MSGEFGRYDYHGYIDRAQRQILEDMTARNVYWSTQLIGEALAPLVELLHLVAYHEEGDHEPTPDEYIKAIKKLEFSLLALKPKLQPLTVVTRVDGDEEE